MALTCLGNSSTTYTSPEGSSRIRPPSLVNSADFVWLSVTTVLTPSSTASATALPIRTFQRRFKAQQPVVG